MLYLYPIKTKEFTHGGHPLPNAVKAKVTEVKNGRYDLTFDYPARDERSKEIEHFSIIMADTPDGPQPFYVDTIESSHGWMNFYCKHVFYFLEGNLVTNLNVGYVKGSDALNTFFQSLKDKHDFTFSSNVNHHGQISARLKESMGVFNDILKTWGGTLLRDGFHISMLQRRGSDTGHLIAKRKNIKDIKGDRSISDVITRLYLSKEVDPKTLIPVENGQGRVKDVVFGLPANPTVTIQIMDADGKHITDDTASFDIYDANGYKVGNNFQTGSTATKATNDKKLYDMQGKKSKLDLELEELRKKETAEKEAIEENPKKKPSESLRDQINRKLEAIDNAQKDIDAWIDVIPGRRIIQGMAPGVYTFIMTSAPKEYYGDYTPKALTVPADTSQWYGVIFNLYSKKHPTATDKIYQELTVDSPLINEYPTIRSQTLEVKEDHIATVEDLAGYGHSKFTDDHIDLPSETFSVKTTPEVLTYGLNIGDTCSVLYTDYNIDKRIEVIEIQYDPVKKRYIDVVLGDAKGGLGSSIGKMTSGYTNKQVTELEARTGTDIDDLSRRWESRFLAITDEFKKDMEEAELIALAEAEELGAMIEGSRVDAVADVEATIGESLKVLEVRERELMGSVLELSTTVDAISAIVQDGQKRALFKVDAQGVSAVATDGTYKSLFTQTPTGFKLSANVIDLQGVVRFKKAVGSDDYDATYVDGGTILTDFIQAQHIASDSITAGKIQAGALRASHIDADYANFVNLSIGRAFVKSIVADKLAVDELWANQIFANHVDAITLSASRIKSGYLASVTTSFQRIYLNEQKNTYIEGNEPVSEINMNTGEFRFMGGLLYYYKGGTRGKLRTLSAFGLVHPDSSKQLIFMELNTGGVQFYDFSDDYNSYSYAYDSQRSSRYPEGIGRVTATLSGDMWVTYRQGARSVRLGSETDKYLTVGASVKAVDSSVNDGYQVLLSGNTWVKGLMYVTGDVYCNNVRYRGSLIKS